MSKTALTLSLIALAAVGGLTYYAYQNSSPAMETNTQTSTPGTPPSSSLQPGAPVALTSASAASTDTTVVLTGSVTPNGVFTNYWYEYGSTPSMGNRTSIQVIGSGFTAIPAPVYITGLVKDTTYYFRLVAENQYGKSTGIQYSFQTTHGVPPPQGSAPTTRTVAADSISRTTANLNGQVTPNRAPTKFWFEFGKTVNLGNVTALQSVGDGTLAVSASVSLSDLTPDTTYYFRLNAQNQFGTVNGAILSFKTNGPPSPASPEVSTRNATSIGSSSATLRGSVDPNGAETTYWFEYSTDSLLGSVLVRSTEHKSAGAGMNPLQVDADISGLNSNTDYFFRIVAQNNQGTVRGERMTFKTQP